MKELALTDERISAEVKILKETAVTASEKSEDTPIITTEPTDYNELSVSSKLSKFLFEPREKKMKYETGFDALDKQLGGGMQHGLHVFGAVSSIGKSTFVLQVANHLLVTGKDVLFFSMEMPWETLVAKTVSQISFDKAVENYEQSKIKIHALREDDIINQTFNKEQKEMLDNTYTFYKDISEGLFIVDATEEVPTISQIEERFNKHIKMRGAPPILVIDYLQYIQNDPGLTDKEANSHKVKVLKRIAMTHKVPVIVISSMNRASYNSRVTMESFKESGDIEYTAEVLYGLNFFGIGQDKFDFNEAKKKTPREIQIDILKNRNGAAGHTIDFEFYPEYSHFIEKGDGYFEQTPKSVGKPQQSQGSKKSRNWSE